MFFVFGALHHGRIDFLVCTTPSHQVENMFPLCVGFFGCPLWARNAIWAQHAKNFGHSQHHPYSAPPFGNQKGTATARRKQPPGAMPPRAALPCPFLHGFGPVFGCVLSFMWHRRIMFARLSVVVFFVLEMADFF